MSLGMLKRKLDGELHDKQNSYVDGPAEQPLGEWLERNLGTSDSRTSMPPT